MGGAAPASNEEPDMRIAINSLTDHQLLGLAQMAATEVDYNRGVLTTLGLAALADEQRWARSDVEAKAAKRDAAYGTGDAGLMAQMTAAAPLPEDAALEAANGRLAAAMRPIDELRTAAIEVLTRKRLYGYGEGI